MLTKCLDFDMKIKLNGKRLYPTDSVKHLEFKNDSELRVMLMPLLQN